VLAIAHKIGWNVEKATTTDEHSAAVVVFQVLGILTSFKDFLQLKLP
jgi:hypothetical protein